MYRSPMEPSCGRHRPVTGKPRNPLGCCSFHSFSRPTANLFLPNEIPKGRPDRGLMMPTRPRTRAEDRRARIEHERGQTGNAGSWTSIRHLSSWLWYV